MQSSYWGYWLVVMGVAIAGLMISVNGITSNTSQDYYSLKEITEASMLEAVDYAYYRDYNEVKMNKEKFMEVFVRMLAEGMGGADSYEVNFYEMFEAPPKVSVEIKSHSGSNFISTSDYDVTTKVDAIIQVHAKEITSPDPDEPSGPAVPHPDSPDANISSGSSGGSSSGGTTGTPNHCGVIVPDDGNKVRHHTYCKVKKERYLSNSWVSADQKTWSYDWVIRFDRIKADDLKIVNVGYLNSDALYNEDWNRDISMVDLDVNNVAPYETNQDLKKYSLKESNFYKVLSKAYYQDGYWYTHAYVSIRNYNSVTPFYSSDVKKYIYIVPFYFDVEYTDLNVCVKDKASNSHNYSDYKIIDTFYQ